MTNSYSSVLLWKTSRLSGGVRIGYLVGEGDRGRMGLRDWERESGREREGKVKVCALVMLGWEGQRDGGCEWENIVQNI